MTRLENPSIAVERLFSTQCELRHTGPIFERPSLAHAIQTCIQSLLPSGWPDVSDHCFCGHGIVGYRGDRGCRLALGELPLAGVRVAAPMSSLFRNEKFAGC
jgi:hypothetical protein